MSQLWRFVGFLLATLALVVTVLVLGPKLLGAAGPEAEIVTALKHEEQRGVSVRLPFGTLRSTELQYQRLSVTLDGSGAVATVTGTLDFVGFLERPSGTSSTSVSSLGLERQRWRLQGRTWAAEDGPIPGLAAVVVALEQRREQLAGTVEAGVTHRVYRAEAWYIRSEREGVTVSEDYRLQEDRRERPIDERGTTRFALAPSLDGGFVVSP